MPGTLPGPLAYSSTRIAKTFVEQPKMAEATDTVQPEGLEGKESVCSEHTPS